MPFYHLAIWTTHSFSLLLRWSTEPRTDRAYPGLTRLRKADADDDDTDFGERSSPSGYSDYHNLYDILNDDEKKSLKGDSKPIRDKDFE